MMRIISLVPAWTEWLGAFGAADRLVGRSHACDAPAEVSAVPCVTRSIVESGDSARIDEFVRNRLEAGRPIYDLDAAVLADLEPDLILTQSGCEACAVPPFQLEEALDGRSVPEVVSMDPVTLKQVLSTALDLGRRIGLARKAMEVVTLGETRLHHLRASLGLRRDTPEESLPRVACVEWMEPLMTAGHWVPDLVEMAGGRAVCAAAGEPSRVVTWDEVRAADPDVVAVMPCGFTIEETLAGFSALTVRPGWAALSAVRTGRVYLFDGRAYFNRPGPRLYRSIELLAAAIHGTRAPVVVEPWEMRPLG